MASTFPEQIDSFLEFLDVTSNDAYNLKLYQQAIQEGDFITAQDCLRNISNYKNKIVNAERLNKFNDAIHAIEVFYRDNIADKIEELENDWSEKVDNLKYDKRYDSTKQYYKNNIVVFNYDNRDFLYICINTPPSNDYDPTNDAYWRQFTIKGNQGQSGDGTDAIFLGYWSADVNYAPNNIVIHNNIWYYANVAHINQEPSETSTYWSVVMPITQNLYIISSDEPIGQREGQLWFEVVG